MWIAGNQYTFEGNDNYKKTANPSILQETISQTIVNQELNKCPIEMSNGISSGKIVEMKQLKCPEYVRNYAAFYPE